METHRKFELLARDFLQQHDSIEHEWRRTGAPAVARTDLLCAPDSEFTVFAILRTDAIVVGDSDGQTDFENLGREISEQKLAAKALAHLIRLLVKNGHIEHPRA